MAYAHYDVDEAGKKPARDLIDAMRKLQAAWDLLTAEREQLIQQKDDTSDYTSIATNYGYTNEATAQASFEEIDGNWDTVNAKIRQMLARHL